MGVGEAGPPTTPMTARAEAGGDPAAVVGDDPAPDGCGAARSAPRC